MRIRIGKVVSYHRKLVKVLIDGFKIDIKIGYPPIYYIPKIGTEVSLLEITQKSRIKQYFILSINEVDRIFISKDGKTIEKEF